VDPNESKIGLQMKDLMLQPHAKCVASVSRKSATYLPRSEGGTMGTPLRNGDRESFRKIEQSIAYMQEHVDRPLQVATLAALVNVSPSHYFALFKRWTGSAPIDYFVGLRMQQARHLLDTTELSIKETATALGYEDPFYFSRVFKSVNRLAPSEYRLSHKNGINGAVRNNGGNLHPAWLDRPAVESNHWNGKGLPLAQRLTTLPPVGNQQPGRVSHDIRRNKAQV
jgi:AraC-like DNA-binding protein